jgi:6-phosphogluconolactonase
MNRTAARPRLEAFAGRDALAQVAASLIGEALERRLQRGAVRASLVASGGSTPAPVYDRLHDWPLDWSRIDVTLSDERWLDPSAPESNQRMLHERLLRGPAKAARLTPLWSPEATLEAAAVRAEGAIAPLMPFDVVLLGMGEDGHFASLFPASPALSEGLRLDGGRLCLGVPAGSPAPPQPRISLTLQALVESRLVLLLTSGEAKKLVLDAALAGADLPVRSLLLQDRTPVRLFWSP